MNRICSITKDGQTDAYIHTCCFSSIRGENNPWCIESKKLSDAFPMVKVFIHPYFFYLPLVLGNILRISLNLSRTAMLLL